MALPGARTLVGQPCSRFLRPPGPLRTPCIGNPRPASPGRGTEKETPNTLPRPVVSLGLAGKIVPPALGQAGTRAAQRNLRKNTPNYPLLHRPPGYDE